MKRILISLALVASTATAAAAGGWDMTLPRLDFPDQGAQASQTQLCSLVTQTCGK